jgi:hypothetical protein
VVNQSTQGSNDFDVTDGVASATHQRLDVYLNAPDRGGATIALTYTGYGLWFGVASETATGRNFNNGVFAYGVPTAPGDVPLSGAASYTAYVTGQAENVLIGGDAHLRFDFASGTLAGEMRPTLLDDWGPTPLGQYDFVQTVYSTGSTTFSGKFAVPGSTADSFFEGQFTGPQAAELMARWQAPFADPYSGSWGTMSGVFVGKKD